MKWCSVLFCGLPLIALYLILQAAAKFVPPLGGHCEHNSKLNSLSLPWHRQVGEDIRRLQPGKNNLILTIIYHCSWSWSTEYFAWDTVLDIAIFRTFPASRIWDSMSSPSRGPFCLYSPKAKVTTFSVSGDSPNEYPPTIYGQWPPNSSFNLDISIEIWAKADNVYFNGASISM